MDFCRTSNIRVAISFLSTSIQLDSACFPLSVWPRVGSLLPSASSTGQVYPITIFRFYSFTMIPTGHFRYLKGHKQRMTNTLLPTWFTQANIPRYYSQILNFENILHFRHFVISFTCLIHKCTTVDCE